ncbi:ABC transporter substrate-binding protein [Plastoroseomonas hellenica]|uniref:ABC transporter substrate-binding protein n=1 Tax=Plastoroseomonas hellenica TaxID=2687306 RepID=UPI001BA9246B|nr:ABC transporter substrate-binding protein [Plastoroseomonas hellenica]MBR0644173.1 ABC transporter substrate-binding protein [Plastoroseomonas hellenica]
MAIQLTRRAAAFGTVAALAAPGLSKAQRGADPRVLRFVPQAALSNLDPIASLASVAVNHGYYVFDTLYGIDAQMRPQPQMAEGHSVSEDGLAWTIRLREGLLFHDGEPVRSRDCAASLRRWGSRDTFGRTVAAAVREYETPDDRTLVIRLSRPFPLMLDAIAKAGTSPAFIMPERLAETDPVRPVAEMIGSGPYRFLANEYVSGSRAAYARFDRYRPRQEAPEWTAGGKVAHFERVEWHMMPDAATASAALQAGEVDWWEQVAADLIPMLRRSRDITIANGDPGGYLGVLRLNHLHPPFDKPAVRRAVLAAVNQADFMAAVTNNDPTAFNICHSFFPCTTPYGRAPSPDPMAAPSLERAQTLLRESGYAGERVVMLNPADFSSIAPLGLIGQDLLTRIGFNVEFVTSDWGTVLGRMLNRNPPAQGGWNVFPVWWTGMGIVTPTQNALIRGQGTAGWSGWYESAEMEALNAEWLSVPDDAARLAIGARMQDLAFRDVASVPLGQFFIRTAYRRSLTGLLEGPRPVPWNLRRA